MPGPAPARSEQSRQRLRFPRAGRPPPREALETIENTVNVGIMPIECLAPPLRSLGASHSPALGSRAGPMRLQAERDIEKSFQL